MRHGWSRCNMASESLCQGGGCGDLFFASQHWRLRTSRGWYDYDVNGGTVELTFSGT